MGVRFPKQEEKLVNDNGTLKHMQRTIYQPGDTGMIVTGPVYRTRMRYGDRGTVNPTGISPAVIDVGDVIEIDKWSNEPDEIGNWRPGIYTGDPEKTKQKVRNLWNLPDVRQNRNGGWLSKFDLGGTVQQPESDKQKRMKELLLIINGAAKELSTKQPGDNVAYLAQVMQDPQEAALIDAIISEIPDAQEVIDQVSQLSSQMFKCGGKTKKKVKKGAKGCVPCKKLMKVGGKLINVWTDCEGRIIHKNAKGGWIVKAEGGIPGGFAYGNQNLLTFDDISKTTGQADESKYYFDPTTNQLMKTTWNATTNKWDAGQSTNDAITAGVGDGQVNLWKEGYNPQTGLFTGETVTYTDKLGVKGKGYTTRAVENNNLITINSAGNAQFSPVQGAEAPYENISYMPKAWRVNRALRDKRREQYYKDLLNGASIDDAKAAKKIQKSIDKNFVYGRDLSAEAAAAVSVHNSKNPNEQIYTVSPTGISYKDLRKANNASASTNLSSTQIVQPELNNGTTGTAYVNPTKIRAAYESKGGWLTKFN